MSGLPAMVNGDGIRKSVQVKFQGYDHRVGAGDGTLWDMENLTGDSYPLLDVRGPRYRLRELASPGGLYAHEGLYWVDGTGFYAGGEKKGTVTAGKKFFVSLGAVILIFPDKAYYRTDNGEFGSLEAVWTGTASFEDGTYNGEPARANTISTAEAAFQFRAGDAVEITGCGEARNNKTAVIREVSEDGKQLRFYENVFSETHWSGAVTLARRVPDLEFACENENRVWGCAGNTIYACKLGDPFNWNVFDGLATDSYAADVGSAGPFTGCCAYLGYPVFFKEDHIYKVYGSKPSNFQIMGSASLGVEQGSPGSLAIAGEKLFYLSRTGVVSYGGGMPEKISAPLGSVRYKNAVGGSDGVKYYVSMENVNGEWNLFVFDTRLGLWHREDNAHALAFAWEKELYFLDADGGLWLGGNPRSVPKGAEREEFHSFAEFADFVEGSPDKKGFSKVQLRAELEAGAALSVLLQFDSDGEWRQVSTLKADRKRSFSLPVIPRRCDHWRLRLEGTGRWRLLSLAREYYEGSDLQ